MHEYRQKLRDLAVELLDDGDFLMKVRHQLSRLVNWASKHRGTELEVVPLEYFTYDYLRKNDRRPAMFNVFVPDDWVKNFDGAEKLRDAYVLLRIPCELLEAYNQFIATPDPIVKITNEDGTVANEEEYKLATSDTKEEVPEST